MEWHADDRLVITIKYDSSFLPRLQLFKQGTSESTLHAFNFSVLNKSNKNLSGPRRVWLKIHHILGHPSMALTKRLAVGGYFGTPALGLDQLDDSDAPMCEACKYGKQTRKPDGTTTTTKNPETTGGLKEGILVPGQRCFSDQLVSVHRGRLFHTAGSESSQDQYCGATIFVDGASGYVYVSCQVTLNANDTINSKHEWERHANEMGVGIQSYHTDNGIYQSKAFTEELAQNYQSIRFSGVGAKWQNGVSEGAIRLVVSKARTLMIHAKLHWPEANDDSLWPMALAHAAYVYNHTPNMESGVCPHEVFSRTTLDDQILKNLHTWGCPAYVLEPKLTEAGGKIPKWKPRSRRGQYLGKSPMHAENVALIRNLRTGYLSPQFHVVFDDTFDTIYADEDEPPPEWDDMCIFQRFQVELDDKCTPPRLADEWYSEEELAQQQSSPPHAQPLRRKMYQDLQSKDVRDDLQYQPPASPNLTDMLLKDSPIRPREHPHATPREDIKAVSELKNWTRKPLQSSSNPSKMSQPLVPPSPVPTPSEATCQPLPPPRRNPPRRAPRQPLNISSMNTKSYDSPRKHSKLASAFVAALSLSAPPTSHMFHAQLSGFDRYTGLQEHMHPATLQSPFYLHNPMALKAKKSRDPDLPSTQEALAGPLAHEFWKSMDKEVIGLEEKGTWTVVPRESVPKGVAVVPGTWQQRIKRNPDGSLNKFKSRFCYRGDLDSWDGQRYSPLVGWPTVRAALLMAASSGWTSRQVDFTLAFCQSPQTRPVYMELPQYYRPRGAFEGKDVVLKLNKTLYGQGDSPLQWFDYLSQGMRKLGFEPAESDPCLFIHKTEKIMVLNYCDDQIWLSPDNALIESYVQRLKEIGYDLEIEVKGSNIFGFLGIEIDRTEDGKIHLTQKGLISKVLTYCGMTKCSGKSTPAAADPLGSDKLGEDFDEEWSYPAAVGMLLYLSSNTRPDIQFAVHQVARFSHCPKKSHAQAVKRILRYLKQTETKGTTFTPDLTKGLDGYVDADFAGLWGHEDEQDPVCVKSRTGFTLTLFGCPIIWQSKLQTEITLSSTAAEYVAFSMAMRELLPMRVLLQEIGTKLGLDFVRESAVRSTVFEDNQGCLSLVNVPKMSPRNKYLALKYHFFRGQIGEDKGIVAKYINTKEQRADIFTKGLPEAQFQVIRKLLIGW